MKKTTLNKTALKKERDGLALYRQYLPSLDLKRKQFLVELRKAEEMLAGSRQEIEGLMRKSAEWLGLLANPDIDLAGLVSVTEVNLGEENILGMRVPAIDRIETVVRPYSLLATPHWVDAAVDLVESLVRLRIKQQVLAERKQRIERALRTITQRVNLFDQVLIPETEKTIRHIEIYLADAERAGVIRAKIAKAKAGKEAV